MDSDDLFGSSVWATGSSTPNLPAKETLDLVDDDEPAFGDIAVAPASDAAFDDFDDFNEPTAGTDDTFGDDFGDFGEAQEPLSATGFDEPVLAAAPLVAEPDPLWGEAWHPLRLEPMPPPHELAEQVETLLAPIYDSDHLAQFLSDDGIRQAEGLNQTLVTPESRALFQSIFASYPPATRPPDWIRSRIRRQHLISLGIPINLDEVLPQANGKPMPELQITTRPASTPPGELGKRSPAVRNVPASSYPSRSGTPQPQSARPGPSSAAQSLGLGPKPSLDKSKVNEMLELETDSLSILPLTKLQSHLVTMRNLTADASAVLTHLLQTKDALQQDSETYNGLIGELVGEATRSKIAQRGRAGSKRSSAFS
ncbi:hypothetical protein EXIGLDRAFT_663071 [Exidia glandulosa HHB12029]|uniref:Uncharacterized protein n=1 Tax=Exidia glandulosa HHB12029 TaxID=1314781 RepID=A0A165QLJ4_EXIGL|nr:hypothetical protein EXIGLDRAFT_663071 [Exidia glandulosa HHB12029]